MASRILAVIAAVAMIAGAYVYRYGAPGSDGGDAGGSGDAAGAVVCASELGTVCDALDGATIEPATVTADRLAGARSVAEAGVAAWVSPGPWPAMVDAVRPSQPPLFGDGEVLGHAALVIATRVAQPIAGCPDAITWRCLGDAAQDPSFRLAADRDSTPSGLFARAAALGGFLGTTDYATNDLDEVPEASGWLANVDRTLDRAGSFGAGSLSQFVITPGAAQGYITTSSNIGPAAARQDIALVAPTPPATVAVVVARATGVDVDIDERALRDALETNGWTVQPPPADDGLPSPGVLVALRGRVE